MDLTKSYAITRANENNQNYKQTMTRYEVKPSEKTAFNVSHNLSNYGKKLFMPKVEERT